MGMLVGYRTILISVVMILGGVINVANGLLADPITVSMMDVNVILVGMGLGTLRLGISNDVKGLKLKAGKR